MKSKKYTERIPAAMNRRSSALTSNKEILDEALWSSGFNESLHNCTKNTTAPKKSHINRNMIWFNPPYSKNVRTKVARTFLEPNQKALPTKPQSPPLYNKSKNNVKVATAACRIWIVSLTTTRISLATTTPHYKTDAAVEKKRPMPSRQQQ